MKMERRNFIKQTLFATGAITLGDNLLHATKSMVYSGDMAMDNHLLAEPVPLRKGIMWASVGIQGSVLEKCKAIKAAGFEGIEPSSGADRKEFADAMKATGLVASSVCNAFNWDFPLSHPDAEKRREAVNKVVLTIEDAKAYGADAILFTPGRVDENWSYEDCWIRSTECIKELVPVADKMQIKICVENVWNNFLLSPLEMRRFVEQFNSKYVGVYFDCGNIVVYGWPEQWITLLGRRIGRVHIKEYSKQIADKEGRVAGFKAPLTEGSVNWAKVIESLRNNYPHVWLTTEQGNSKTLEELKDLNNRFDKILSM